MCDYCHEALIRDSSLTQPIPINFLLQDTDSVRVTDYTLLKKQHIFSESGIHTN